MPRTRPISVQLCPRFDEVADLRLDRELDGDLLVDQRPEPVELVLPHQVRPHR